MNEQEYLEGAKNCIDKAVRAPSYEATQAEALLAIANAMVAWVELLTAVVRANEEASNAG